MLAAPAGQLGRRAAWARLRTMAEGGAPLLRTALLRCAEALLSYGDGADVWREQVSGSRGRIRCDLC